MCPYSVPMSEYGHTAIYALYTLDKLYIIDESIR